MQASSIILSFLFILVKTGSYLKLLFLVVLNSIATVSSTFPVANEGGGQNNIESICSS